MVTPSPSIVDLVPTTYLTAGAFDKETRRPTSCHRASLTGSAVKLPPAAELVDSDPTPLLTQPPIPSSPHPPLQQVHVVTVRRDVSQCTEERILIIDDLNAPPPPEVSSRKKRGSTLWRYSGARQRSWRATDPHNDDVSHHPGQRTDSSYERIKGRERAAILLIPRDASRRSQVG